MAKKEIEVKKETEQTPEVETVSQDQFKQLQESLEALQTELEQVKKAKEEEKDQYMRVLAEYDNYRKRTTKEKIMTYLMSEAKRAGSNFFTIPYNRQELADYLGVERSAMSAELGKLRDEGLIEFQKSHFKMI